MSRAFSLYILTLSVVALSAGRSFAQRASNSESKPPQSSAARLVVLRNGEVLEGHVVSSADRVLVSLPGREISLRQSEIDVVAGSLEEAYALKRLKVGPTDVEGRLDLATWCLKHDLKQNAAAELSTVSTIQPFHARLAALDRRLQKALTGDAKSTQATDRREAPASGSAEKSELKIGAPSQNKAGSRTRDPAASWPPKSIENSVAASSATKSADSQRPEKPKDSAALESPMALERFVRALPSQAVEQFTSNLQPMITQGCATAGCHAPGNTTDFTLLRLPQGKTTSRRLTQRNLYNTVQLVDFAKPGESRLLKVASQPHGPLTSGVFGDQRSPKYRELVAWVAGLTGTKLDRPEPADETGIAGLRRSAPSAAAAEQSATNGKNRSRGAGKDKSADSFPGSVQPATYESSADALEPNQPAEIKPRASAPAKKPPSRKSP